MRITEKENLLPRRALDSATTDAEAETAAKAFVHALRSRKVSGYDFVPAERANGPAPRPQQPAPPSPAAQQQPTPPPWQKCADDQPAPKNPFYGPWAILSIVGIAALLFSPNSPLHSIKGADRDTPLTQEMPAKLGSAGNPIRVKSQQEFETIPSGTWVLDADNYPKQKK